MYWFYPLIILLQLRSSYCTATEQKPLREAVPKGPFDEKFDVTAQLLMGLLHVPGLSIAVVHNNETFTKGYGYARIPDVPAMPSTLYYTGSTTKAFTVAALSKLVDNGTISWDTKIQSVLGETFEMMADPWVTSHITIEDALTHRTGLPRHDLSFAGHDATLEQTVRSIRYLPTTQEPRVIMQYCNIFYAVAGYVFERVTGTWLGHFLREHIWSPLGMQRTFYTFSQVEKSRYKDDVSYPYDYVAETDSYVRLPWNKYLASIAPAGTIISSVEDYAKWLHCLIYQLPPVSKAAHKQMTRPHIAVAVEFEHQPLELHMTYGYGWLQMVYRGSTVIMHDGGLPGYGTLVGFVPELQWGATFMSNVAGTSNQLETILFFHLIDEVLNIPHDERLQKEDIAKIFTFKHAPNSTLATWDAPLSRPVHSYEDSIPDSLLDKIYPDLPNPRLPSPLPFHAFVGNYTHGAYGTFTLTYNSTSKTLHTYIDRLLSLRAEIQHVSGEYWFAVFRNPDSGVMMGATKVKFEFEASGVVSRMGAVMDQMYTDFIWLERDEDPDMSGGHGEL